MTKKSYFLSWLQALSKEKNNQIYSNFGRRITASKKNNEEIRLKQIIVYNNNHCPDAFQNFSRVFACAVLFITYHEARSLTLWSCQSAQVRDLLVPSRFMLLPPRRGSLAFRTSRRLPVPRDLEMCRQCKSRSCFLMTNKADITVNINFTQNMYNGIK